MNFHLKSLRRSGRAALFLSLCVTVAFCKRPEQDLGLNLQPEGDLLNVFHTDTLTLKAYTLVEDSLRTNELSQSLLGNTIDPETGSVRASFYSQLRLAAPDINFGPNAVCDSIVLALKYTGQFYGPLVPQAFSVYELSEAMTPGESYFSNQDFAYYPENLVAPGTGALPIQISTNSFVGGDSLSPQLRIPLSLDLGTRLINAGTDVYSTNTSWLEYFKGIYVMSNTLNASVLNFDLVDVESRMQLYYHNDNDTLSFDFNINSLCSRNNRYEHQFANDLSGLSHLNPLDGSQQTWVQGGARVKTRIVFPHIDELKNDPERVINKAELFLPITNESAGRYPNQALLFVVTETADGNPVGLPGQLSTAIDIGGNFEPANNRYRFNITRWLQEYVKGNQAVNFLHIVSSNAGITVQRAKLNGPDFDDSDPARNMRLVITYSL